MTTEDAILELQRLPDRKLQIKTKDDTHDDFDIVPSFMADGHTAILVHESSDMRAVKDKLADAEDALAKLEVINDKALALAQELKVDGYDSDQFVRLITELIEVLS